MAAGERIRLFYTPERPKPGEFVSLAANAFDANGAPLNEGILQVDLTAPNGQIKRIELTKKEGAWGRFTGKFKVSQPGQCPSVACTESTIHDHLLDVIG